MNLFKKFIKGTLLLALLAMFLYQGSPVVRAEHCSDDMPPLLKAECEKSHAEEEEEPPSDEEILAKIEALVEGAKDKPQSALNKADAIQEIAKAAEKTHRLFGPLINFFSFQIGNFLGHDYVYTGAMGKMLQKIWVISRNIVNIVFVFLLLIIALSLVFNPSTEKGAIPGKLLIFTLLLVAVNFSYLGTKVVLDAAGVVTHVVFAIPSGISTANTGVNVESCKVNDIIEPSSEGCFPAAIYAPVDSGGNEPLNFMRGEGEDDECKDLEEGYADAYEGEKGTGKPRNPAEMTNREKNEVFQRRTSICWENLNLFKYDQNTAVVYLTYGSARVQNLINSNAGDDFAQLTVGVIMSLVIQLAYSIALIALWIALIIRMIMLWLLVAFSPFIILMLYWKYGGGQQNPFEAVSKYFSLEAFFKWAFVPAKVGAIFAVSFIIISAGQTMGEGTISIIDNLNKGGFTFKIYNTRSLFMGMDSLQSFIWLIVSLVILWMGTFAVLEDMPIVSSVTNRIRDYGISTARFLGKAAYVAPILPLGKEGEKISAKGLISPIDIRGKAEAYALPEEGARETLKIRDKVKDFKVSSIQSYLDKGLTKLGDSEKAELARTMAKELKYSNAKDLGDAVEKQTAAFTAGFMDDKKLKDTDAKALADILKKFSTKAGPAAVAAAPAAPGKPAAEAAPAAGGAGGAGSAEQLRLDAEKRELDTKALGDTLKKSKGEK